MKLLSKFVSLFSTPPPPPPEVGEGLNRIGELFGPSVANERNFERRLAEPVANALSYCDRLVAALPPSIDIHRAAFAENPLVHALFASADDIPLTLARSAALREYMEQPQAWLDDHFHALLAARRHEKKVLGAANRGQMIATDVPQRLLYFSDQAMTLPAADEAGARARLRQAAFDSLLQSFVSHLDTLRHGREDLLVERELERVRLRTSRDAEMQERYARRLDELDARLRADSDALQPEHQIGALAELLMAPEQALSMAPLSFRVDRAGKLVEGEAPAGEPLHTLSFIELTSRDRRRHVVLPVRIPREDLTRALEQARVERDRIVLI
ncbi:hypothetical protein E6C76_08845 [Pseudothauera nasutitermitis]|uniref:Uncharacterized protein n=1 Tax=Pseudothauera nasutitermitis TaxID=2565930 RepID=A0A4S4B0U5_9RHOO|nr:hypothetical protein [Pseudothauera nasutitermitis]THF65662.1 hypothetical protein E6C76_08845 [Pseudothauera nasutitermitis]